MADDEKLSTNHEAYEEEHVHQVYEQIATHFSSTRYKPWPIVEKFLQDRPDGSVGLDVGCGNGKYLAVNPNIFIVASDRSGSLATIAAHHQPHSAVVADNLQLPHPRDSFDFALSIAVIHHLSSTERRVAAIREVLATLRPGQREKLDENDRARLSVPGSTVLIYVWALEQKQSRRGWDESHEQDVMVPWVMTSKGAQARGGGARKPTESDSATANETHGAKLGQGKTFQRYYHLYRAGELERDIRQAGGVVVDAGYEKDNWWAIAGREG